ncbi:MAG: rRNA pseudouridine synthase [Anaerolineaceae bacterium]|nr:rRNA pseudouridine synthase [Anaerolineaceae bacterium]MBN2677474.1 rRNA pseudouridine synthase [Anaerolineaceae bacterium]
MGAERVQKILAQAGYGSRRECEKLISAGRVIVNNKVIKLGDKADCDIDSIQVDHSPIKIKHEKIYIALNKPRWVLSDRDPSETRKTIFDLIPRVGHIFTVGRLDYDSEGLILMTNDGELANQLTHPRYEHEKEYQVQVARRPDSEQLAIWKRGVVLEDGYRTAPCRVEVISGDDKGVWLKIVLKEGKKRQIREVGKRIGLPVKRIIRLRIGTVLLGDLKPGTWRNLTKGEVVQLQKAMGTKQRK